MVVVRELAFRKLSQYSNPVLTCDAIHANLQSRPLNNMVLFAKSQKLIGFRKLDISHQPREIALTAHLDSLIMRVVEFMVAKARHVDLELV